MSITLEGTPRSGLRPIFNRLGREDRWCPHADHSMVRGRERECEDGVLVFNCVDCGGWGNRDSSWWDEDESDAGGECPTCEGTGTIADLAEVCPWPGHRPHFGWVWRRLRRAPKGVRNRWASKCKQPEVVA